MISPKVFEKSKAMFGKYTGGFLSSALMVIVGIVFIPSLGNQFVNWDDNQYIVQSPFTRTLSFEAAGKLFSSFYLCNYHPLTLLSYAVDYQVYGFAPYGYHLTNLLLHLFNCVLVFWFIRALVNDIYAAFVTALLFGVHPLHVESVAWVSARKDLLYTLFFLSSLIAYCGYKRFGNKAFNYAAAVLFFLFSLLSKPLAIILPFALFLIDYLHNEGFKKKTLIEKAPFFVLSAVFTVIALFSQAGAIRREEALGLFGKIQIASYSIIFYLKKVFLPFKLSCLYPFPEITNEYIPLVYTGAFFAVVILAGGIVISSKFTKRVVFGSLFFLFSIFPTLQFMPYGAIITADRYTYLPLIGIFFIIASGCLWCIRRLKSAVFLKMTVAGLFFAAVLFFSFLSYQRCTVWKDGLSLWSDAIDHYPQEYIPIAYYNRAMIYLGSFEDKKAFFDLHKALQLYYSRLKNDSAGGLIVKSGALSDEAEILFNLLGTRFAEIGRQEEATGIFSKLIERYPERATAYLNLCVMYARAGKYEDAAAFGEQAVKLNPRWAAAHFNLGLIYYYSGKVSSAKLHLTTARELGFQVPEGLPSE